MTYDAFRKRLPEPTAYAASPQLPDDPAFLDMLDRIAADATIAAEEAALIAEASPEITKDETALMAEMTTAMIISAGVTDQMAALETSLRARNDAFDAMVERLAALRAEQSKAT